ncbi:MAG: hypothetical protein U5M23_15500 [Marinagarivorans sp.]|nr:hypothetical protein [Marinagarivorans sp.]
MSSKPHTIANKKKQPAAVACSQSIADQTEAFLKSGGKISQINSGISGQASLAPRPVAAKAE